ncbi:MAG: hypothetical protein KAV45_14290 [Calditrichia bacterium]|jgi:hypothetical protein|nr:hypothetical protein [Calditrichia bacterium]
MSSICLQLHQTTNSLTRFTYPYDNDLIPQNGIYILFENGEPGHDMERIVRIGTHKGKGRLLSRLDDHFIESNQRNSIFRKHLGRCFLSKANDDYIKSWDLPFKKRTDKIKYKDRVDLEYEKKYEKMITKYIQKKFSFVIIPNVNKKSDRKHYESRIIATVSNCNICIPSKDWLGRFHPNTKINESGL